MTMTTIESTTNGNGSALATENDLDSAVERVRELQQNFAKEGWRIGREILNIQESGMWRTRKAIDRAALRYSTFADFCAEELKMTERHANRFAAAARAFTEKQFANIGIYKSTILLQEVNFDEASPAEKARLATLAESTSARVLKQTLTLEKSPDIDPPASSDDSPKRAPSASGTTVAPPKPREVSLVLVEDRVVKVPLLARQKKNTAEVSPAKIQDLKDGNVITARHEVSKRLAIWFTLRQNPAGHLELCLKPLAVDREKK